MEGGHQYVLSIVLSLAALVSFYIGIVVLQTDRTSKHRWFFILAASSAVWAMTNALFAIVPVPGRVTVALLSYGAAAVLATGFLKFCLAITSVGAQKRSEKVFVGIGLVVALLSAVPGIVLIGVTADLQIETRIPALLAYGVFLVGSLLAGVVLLVQGYARSNRLEKQRIATMIGSLAVGATIGIVCNLIFPMFGNYTLVQIGPLGVLVFIAGSFYAIARHRLFDIRAAVVRTMAYTLSLAALALMYYGLAYIASRLLEDLDGAAVSGLSSVYVVLALVSAFLFQPIKNIFDRLTSRLFYRNEYDSDAFFAGFGKIISHDTDLQLLTRRVSGYMVDGLGAESAFFYLFEKGVVGRHATRKTRLPEPDVAILADYCRTHDRLAKTIVTEFVTAPELKRVLLGHRIGMSLPLVFQGEVMGFLFLGEHKGRGYTVRNIRALESILNELTIAVQNSLFVEEIRELNSSLTQRVDEATRELKSSNRQLQKLDTAKDEFISMASHQLRTPLTSIKGYLDMVLDGDLGKITATQRSVLSEAYISSERMVTLINDFLNVSRLQTGKFIIDKRETDMVEMLKEQVQMLSVVAKQHGLRLDLQVTGKVPRVWVDGDKLRQVMLNMIDNAIYYSAPSTTIDVMLARDGDDVMFSVKDTGIGVPESEKSGLFGKFFRASNARKKRPDGTGVGLFLSRKVVLAHGGDIIFWSKEGKGSVFGFRVPIGLKEADDAGDDDSATESDK